MIQAAIAAFRLFSKIPKTTKMQSVAIDIRIVADSLSRRSEIKKRAPKNDSKSTMKVPLFWTARGDGSNCGPITHMQAIRSR
jgi:hypothetical protein